MREALDTNTMKTVAIKIITKSQLRKLPGGGEASVRQEIAFMKRLKPHAQHCHLIDSFANGKKGNYILSDSSPLLPLPGSSTSYSTDLDLPFSLNWRKFIVLEYVGGGTLGGSAKFQAPRLLFASSAGPKVVLPIFYYFPFIAFLFFICL